jgi:hypothetical protein
MCTLQSQVDQRRQQRTADRDEILRRLAAFDEDENTEFGAEFDSSRHAEGHGSSATNRSAAARSIGHRMTSSRRAALGAAAAASGVCTAATTGSMSSLQLCYVNLQYASVGKDLDMISNDDITNHEVDTVCRSLIATCCDCTRQTIVNNDM